MQNNHDRRTQPRIQIQNSSVLYKNPGILNLFYGYSGPGELVDISKSGAGFTVLKAMNKNEQIRVKIFIPGEKEFLLHGEVRWVMDNTHSGNNRIGMQFSPFGSRRHYNSPESLTRLGGLIEKLLAN
jgi:hypothetical protein